MPNFDIVKKSNYEKSFRNESVKNQFDLNVESIVEHFKGSIDIENKDWSVGVIVGSSGSGKTTIAGEVFGEFKNFKYDNNKSVLDEMPKNKTTEQITKAFNSVGFGTVWSWLKPYNVLSNGEKMRVDLAYSMLLDDEIIVFDEFTSVVDRTIAKTASYAIQKSIRKTNKKFVAVSCHYDILEWLEPDWVYDTNKKQFFFAQKNTQDQKSKLKLESVQQKNGVFLKNIII
jgi:ABC-type ATPase with predicted acetyltransferase domain